MVCGVGMPGVWGELAVKDSLTDPTFFCLSFFIIYMLGWREILVFLSPVFYSIIMASMML